MSRCLNQADFFAKNVQPRWRRRKDSVVFVIISDAFRYEAAQELAAELNGKYRFEAELTSQLGVLPSYTALGMASLLPHKTLSYKPTGDVLVDGKPTSSLAQRSDILASVDGMAVKADDLLAMKKDEGRDFVSGKRVIYIYHDTVDAMATTPRPRTIPSMPCGRPSTNWHRWWPTSSTISTATTWSSRPTTASSSPKRPRRTGKEQPGRQARGNGHGQEAISARA